MYKRAYNNFVNQMNDNDKSLMERIEKFLSMDDLNRKLIASLIDRIEIVKDNNIYIL